MKFLDGPWVWQFCTAYIRFAKVFWPNGGKMQTFWSPCCKSSVTAVSPALQYLGFALLCQLWLFCLQVSWFLQPDLGAAVSPALQYLGLALLCQIWPHPPSPGLLCWDYDVQLLLADQRHHRVPGLLCDEQDVQLLLQSSLWTEQQQRRVGFLTAVWF